ncbi:MAG: SDR family oxidoreductase [Rhodobacteraceae bacterium]|nr:SDR family oxidoreductase [Paracoccaceae bacterium]
MALVRTLTSMGIVLAAIGLVFGGSLPAHADAVLITGASQGHGLAFAEDYAARGWTVIATARDPSKAADLQALAKRFPNIAIEELDITDYAEVDALAAKYKQTPIDVLNLNGAINTFRFGPNRFGKIDYAWLDTILKTNVTAQLYVAEAFLDSVAAGKQKKIVAMSAVGGSIGRVNSAMAPGYRASKAALNMLMRTFGEYAKDRGVAVLVIAPGTVDTQDYMSRKDLSGVPERYRRQIELGVLAPRSAIGAMIDLIDRLGVADIDKFHQWDGQVLPW